MKGSNWYCQFEHDLFEQAYVQNSPTSPIYLRTPPLVFAYFFLLSFIHSPSLTPYLNPYIPFFSRMFITVDTRLIKRINIFIW